MKFVSVLSFFIIFYLFSFFFFGLLVLFSLGMVTIVARVSGNPTSEKPSVRENLLLLENPNECLCC
jgi:uncharacterized membrane protein